MNLDQAKQELIRRYKYLYENAYLILEPFMYEQSEKEFLETQKRCLEKYHMCPLKEPSIYLKIDHLDRINSLFEEFLLSDKPLEKTLLYMTIESKRNNKYYLEEVKIGLKLLEKLNAKQISPFKTKLDIGEILEKVTSYIEEQSGDLKTKKRKLKVIREYTKIAGYRNKEKALPNPFLSDFVMPKEDPKPLRDKKDIGIKNNNFISLISLAPFTDNNDSIFTEDERQEIYLEYHDELPWNLEITCALEEGHENLPRKVRPKRPDNTKPCGNVFYIKEEEIFVNPKEKKYRYYELCPHCGYMVNIPEEILSVGIKARIENKCSQDKNSFRRNYLTSELFVYDKLTRNQEIILKK